ncbi:MAG: hypothetical protein KIT18_11075, partial [Burkholderiales bacterium]|nr:hypothetical protein [Burkholderiales bacterium]
MANAPKIAFTSVAPGKATGTLVVFCDDGVKFGASAEQMLRPAAGLLARAAKAERFNGKAGTALELLVPDGLKADRLVVIGAGKAAGRTQQDWVKLGGAALGKLPKTGDA